MTDDRQTYRCAYCGSVQQRTGNGPDLCTHCGATQPVSAAPASGTAQAEPAKNTRLLLLALCVSMLVIGVITLLYFFHKPEAASTPVIVADPRAGKVTSPVPGSRIIRVDNPHVRIIPEGVEFDKEDLVAVPEGTSSLVNFDPSLLQVRQPRRLLDETGHPAFLGEVTNTSPNLVVANPEVTLVLTRGGRVVDKATRSFADLTPGAHVPLYFHYDGATKAFDNISFQWHALKAYPLGDPKHSRFTAKVTSQQPMTAAEAMGHPTPFHYNCVRVHGTVVNISSREARKVAVYVVLRDAQGQITGFDHDELMIEHAGESSDLTLTPTIMGAPAVSAEMYALPFSPPSL